MKIKDIGEFELIERLRAKTSVDRSVVKGIGDECAVLKFSKDEYMLITCDMLVEGIHFDLKFATPWLVGRKALACCISDIAAMGGVPKDALVAIGIDPGMSLRFVDRLYHGMKQMAHRFGINIVGGDLVRSKGLNISTNLTGLVKKDRLTLRSGAKDNDAVMVTGTLGGSIHRKHLTFIPRLGEAQVLVKRFKINAMIDISDGLAQDLVHIAAESGLGAIIYERDIPISLSAYRQAKKEGKGPLQLALGDGEDYELLFTMSKKEARRLLSSRPRELETRVTMIGQMIDEPGLWLVDRRGAKSKLRIEGWRHF